MKKITYEKMKRRNDRNETLPFFLKSLHCLVIIHESLTFSFFFYFDKASFHRCFLREGKSSEEEISFPLSPPPSIYYRDLKPYCLPSKCTSFS